MKRIVLLAVCGFSCLLLAHPKSITTRDTLRRGLTDAQYEVFYETHPNATISIGRHDWLAMQYEIRRFHNLTNWFTMIAERADAAALLLRQADTNETLVAATKTLAASVSHWRGEAQAWYTDYTNETAVTKRKAEREARVRENISKIRTRVENSPILINSVKTEILNLLDSIMPEESKDDT